MSDMLKPYAEYNKCKLPWLEEIPSHWKIKRAKALYKKENRPVREEDEVITCFRDGVVTLRKNRRVTGFTESIKEVGYQGVRKGDLVIHVMDAFAGAVGVSDSDGKSTPVYSVCNPVVPLNNYYYAHVIRKMAKSGFIQSLYRGIRERSSDFRFDTFANQYLPIPPKEEQDQIVKYLEFKLQSINKVIKAKKKQIALLKEQKQVVINNAVTKGLDPNVKMKASGVEWLGDIPAGWELIRNKNVLRIKKDLVGQESSKYDLLSLTTNGIIKRDIESGKGKFPSDFSSYQKVEENNIVFCLFDIDETPRTVGLSKLNGMITGAYSVFEVDVINKEYIYYYYLALDNKKALKPLYTGLRKVINTDLFLRTKMLYPPLEEQQEIVNFINVATKNIDFLIDKIEQKLKLVIEYKSSLISDVVTGKIDVRDIKIEDVGDIQEFIIDETEIEDTDVGSESYQAEGDE